MSKKHLSLLILPAALISLGSCSNNKKPDKKPEPDPKPTVAPIDFEGSITNLSKGFKVDAKLTTTKNYFVDEKHEIADASRPQVVTNYDSVLTYTDKDDYIGFDFKHYLVNADKSKTYISSDNIFNNEERVAFNYVDYDNVLKDDSFAVDENDNFFSYGASGLVNPFKMINTIDFAQEGAIASLSRAKTNLLIGGLYSQIPEVPANINIDSNSFIFEDNTLKSARISSFPFNITETVGTTNIYPQVTYEFNLAFSEIGTADSKKEIAAEPEKLECVPLQDAIDRLASAGQYVVKRHYKARSNGEQVKEQEAINAYFDNTKGPNGAVYQAVYQWQNVENGNPTEATEADGLYVDTNNNGKLDAFMLSEGKFKPTSLLASIDDAATFSEFGLPNLAYVNANTFNKNADGSFTPIVGNLKTIAGDCFLPFICNVSEVSGGYVDSFKLYLGEDEQGSFIDRIELTAEMGKISSEITLYYELGVPAEGYPFDSVKDVL